MKKIGVLTSGGDAPGMNAAIRAVTRTALYKGMEVIGIRRGYNGLIHGDVFDMNMRTVSSIIQRGGTLLFTARCPEFKEEAGVLKAVESCKQLGIEGLVVIGGDGSYRGAGDLSAHGIPCIGIPGTIDNDISSTDYTIGYDTAMNTVMELVDKLRETCHSHDRCSVVEVMGRRAGYIAVNTAVACGATDVLCPEKDFDLKAITDKMLRTRELGKQNFIIVVAEGVIADSTEFTSADQIAKYIEEKTGIESRATVLGHVQRGGSPTVRDRVLASRLGYYAVNLLEQGIGNRVVGVRGNELVNYDIQEALKMKKPFEEELYTLSDIISI